MNVALELEGLTENFPTNSAALFAFSKVTWNEFLLDQALYLISARPNNTNLHTNNRVGLRGIVPPPTDITEPQDQKESEEPDSLDAV